MHETVYQSRFLYLNLSFNNKDDDDLSKLERGRIYSSGNTIIVRVLRNQNYWKGSAWQINQPAFLLGAGWKNKATPVKVDSNVEKYEHCDHEDPREGRSPTSVRLTHGVIRGPINPGIWAPPPSNYGPSRLAFSVKIFNEAGAVSFKVYRHCFILMSPVDKNCIEKRRNRYPFSRHS